MLCKRLGCSNSVPQHQGRGRPPGFCSDRCRVQYHNSATGAIRAAESRALRASGSPARTSDLLSARPRTRTGRDEQVWTEIESLEKLVHADAHVADVREHVREQSAVLFAVMNKDGTGTVAERACRARLFTVLTMVGTEGAILRRKDADTVCGYANQAAALFRSVDSANYARAVFMCGAVYRMCERSTQARRRFDRVHALLRDQVPRDRDQAALSWNAHTQYLRDVNDSRACELASEIAAAYPFLRVPNVREQITHAAKFHLAKGNELLDLFDEMTVVGAALTTWECLRNEKMRVWYFALTSRRRELRDRLHNEYARAQAAHRDGFTHNEVGTVAEIGHVDEPDLSEAQYRLPGVPYVPLYIASRHPNFV